MDLFNYTEDGRLTCEDVDLAELAAQVGTPAYVYSGGTLDMHFDRLRDAFADVDPLICFSVKSNSNLHVLRRLVARGAGLDVVSGGELHRARLAGADPSKIVFAGVGKTREEIADALGASPLYEERHEPIGLFNVESEGECERIREVAQSLGVTANCALRVNPDVDAKTHKYTTTGLKENKFGVDIARAVDVFRRFNGTPNLNLNAIHMHIGSPVYETGPYVEAVKRALALIDDLATHDIRIEKLNFGGGFAADYQTGKAKRAVDYAGAIVPLLRDRVQQGLKLVMEPGRTIAANAGVLLTRVQFVKSGRTKLFIICDAGMHTLLRPPLYQSFHFIWPVRVSSQHIPPSRAEKLDLPGLEPCDVVGPICESADFLAQNRSLPPVAPGDLLAVFGAGAYGMTMASRYNSHGLPPEVMVEGRRAQLIRRRETYADLIEHELEAEDLDTAPYHA
jgi:diaminopimelate decarboxylase